MDERFSALCGVTFAPLGERTGDYDGQTVNVASGIAQYARPGEVLVSQEVVDASGESDVAFREIGPVERAIIWTRLGSRSPRSGKVSDNPKSCRAAAQRR